MVLTLLSEQASSRRGASRIKKIIEDYWWKKYGLPVKLEILRATPVGTDRFGTPIHDGMQARFDIRSNMINGYPAAYKLWRGK